MKNTLPVFLLLAPVLAGAQQQQQAPQTNVLLNNISLNNDVRGLVNVNVTQLFQYNNYAGNPQQVYRGNNPSQAPARSQASSANRGRSRSNDDSNKNPSVAEDNGFGSFTPRSIEIQAASVNMPEVQAPGISLPQLQLPDFSKKNKASPGGSGSGGHTKSTHSFFARGWKNFKKDFRTGYKKMTRKRGKAKYRVADCCHFFG